MIKYTDKIIFCLVSLKHFCIKKEKLENIADLESVS